MPDERVSVRKTHKGCCADVLIVAKDVNDVQSKLCASSPARRGGTKQACMQGLFIAHVIGAVISNGI